MAIPVIDIFAGPGGLGEGFSALLDDEGKRVFNVVLSIEKDPDAHKTLTLRSFFRQFEPGRVPDDYYEFLRGKIKLEELYCKYPKEQSEAKEEAWLAELGEGEKSVSADEVDRRITKALAGEKNWLLIGGPPCQAYSVIGRSRRKEDILDEETDERVGLYRQYLRILAAHHPAVFIMENVKGLLSAKTKESPVFSRILRDLASPFLVYGSEKTAPEHNGAASDKYTYRIYSLVVQSQPDLEGGFGLRQEDYVIRMEKYGIPQARHRIILVGVRNDIDVVPDVLTMEKEVPAWKVLEGLPKVRSGITRRQGMNGDKNEYIRDDESTWKNTIVDIQTKDYLSETGQDVREEMIRQIKDVQMESFENGTGAEYIHCEDLEIHYKSDWFYDEKIKGVCNHSARGHMDTDLHRYLFASCFAKVRGVSPKLEDFPSALLPAHNNVKEGVEEKKFADRFRVQVKEKPAKTITSHISKDGHYYIYPVAAQCRSLTVREAARIQTFPDNYYFCGPRTAQFIQVGNAVPPLLANQIAKIVSKTFEKIKNEGSHQYTKRFKNF